MFKRTKLAATATALILVTSPGLARATVIDSYTTTENSRGTVYNISPNKKDGNLSSSSSSHDPGPEMESKGIPATPSLVGQLTCHVIFAPGKPIWNLEDWRPEVTFPGMVASACNP
ncbi:hypothetical protein COCCU_09860 [Corynebacterium occultum]|uniref:DUF2599 domain-containing protein n=1 Tax=Corynebacterium occultum TaxID=2675219 RepID=A0A6B8W9F5_9CORY|nr:DUF2599 domain-containing protein [Corynebacterium occultum]QGU07895.1 hypothetical protein COCCU_09860 [Corynebacterium occultum]